MIKTWMSQETRIVMVPDRRRINLGNSKSSELMSVKVRGIRIVRQ